MASFFSTLFGGGAEKEAAEKNRIAGQVYNDRSMGFLDDGLRRSTGAINEATSAFTPLAALGDKYGAATTLGMNALGVNGADAAKTAWGSFTNNPGTEAAIDAGLSAINRRRAAGGMLGSGNADLDALTFGQNLQNGQQNTWLQNLLGFTNPELSATSGAASGVAGTKMSLADLYKQDAENRIGVTGNLAQTYMGANNQQAAGQASGARNLLSGLSTLGGMAMSAFGGGGMGGGFGFGGVPDYGQTSNNIYGGLRVPTFGRG